MEPHRKQDEAAPAPLGWPSSPTDAQVPECRELTATDAAQAVSVSALPQAEQHLGHALRRVQALPTATAYQLARAFAFFFELINLAENDGRWRTMV